VRIGSVTGEQMVLNAPGFINPFGIAVVPIPEPSTAALLALGLVGLAARRSYPARRRLWCGTS
jgi:hypothetical protein